MLDWQSNLEAPMIMCRAKKIKESLIKGVQGSMSILWRPTLEQIEKANTTKFIDMVNSKFQLSIDSYQELYEWSISEIEKFWACVWEWGGIIASPQYTRILREGAEMLDTRWFEGARLNFAENLLRYRDEQIALIAAGENGDTRRISYAELFRQVAGLAGALRDYGIQAGDRVAGYLPNIPEAVIAMLAASSIGAIWSSCSPDFGFKGVVDRFGQIEPRLLFCCNGYYYNGKHYDSVDKVKQIAAEIKSIEKIIMVPFTDAEPKVAEIDKAVLYQDFISQAEEWSLPGCLLIIRFTLCIRQAPPAFPNVWFTSGGHPYSAPQGTPPAL
jgi:acetoacetyl-CoA synthetase